MTSPLQPAYNEDPPETHAQASTAGHSRRTLRKGRPPAAQPIPVSAKSRVLKERLPACSAAAEPRARKGRAPAAQLQSPASVLTVRIVFTQKQHNQVPDGGRDQRALMDGNCNVENRRRIHGKGCI